jgi:PIN domain nuclease of toxin-antitoxin system
VIVVDTHAWVWWVSGSAKLSAHARKQIERSSAVGVPAIVCWEVAMLVAHHRLELDRDVLEWIQQGLSLPKTEILPLTSGISVRATRLEGFHGDPADRIIVATAQDFGASVVSRDQRIREFKAVVTVW